MAITAQESFEADMVSGYLVFVSISQFRFTVYETLILISTEMLCFSSLCKEKMSHFLII